MNSIGPRLGAWRMHRGLTQSAVAARARVPQPVVSDAERGVRDLTLRTVFRLARALDVTPGTLLDRDPPRRELTRHQIDAIARAVVSGRRALPPRLRSIANACAGATRPTLEACDLHAAVRGRTAGPSALRAVRNRFGRPVIDQILDRIERFAAAAS